MIKKEDLATVLIFINPVTIEQYLNLYTSLTVCIHI